MVSWRGVELTTSAKKLAMSKSEGPGEVRLARRRRRLAQSWTQHHEKLALDDDQHPNSPLSSDSHGLTSCKERGW
jgi:hypothetical protein